MGRPVWESGRAEEPVVWLGALGDDNLYTQGFIISERTPYSIGSPSFVIREKLTLS